MQSRREFRITYTLRTPDILDTALNLLGVQAPFPANSTDARSQRYVKTAELACKVFNEIRDRNSEKDQKRSVDRLLRQLESVADIYVVERFYRREKNVDTLRLISQARENFRSLENTFEFYLPDYIPELPNRLEVSNKEGRNTMANKIIKNLRHVYWVLMDLREIIDADTELLPADKEKEKEFLLLAKICQVKLHQEYCKFHWLQSLPSDASSHLSSVGVRQYNSLFYGDQVNELILLIEKAICAPLTQAGIYYSPSGTFDSIRGSLERYEREQAPAVTTQESNRLFRIARSFSLWARPVATDAKTELVKKKLEEDKITSEQAKLFLSLVKERVSQPLSGLIELHELIGFTKEAQQEFFKDINLNDTLTSSLQQIHQLYIELTTQERNYPHALQDQACKALSFELMQQFIDLHEHCRKLIGLLKNNTEIQKHLRVCEGLIILLSPGRARLFEYDELLDDTDGDDDIQRLTARPSPM